MAFVTGLDEDRRRRVARQAWVRFDAQERQLKCVRSFARPYQSHALKHSKFYCIENTSISSTFRHAFVTYGRVRYRVRRVSGDSSMKYAAIALAVCAFLTGLRAARLWYLASKVHVMPFWSDGQSIEPVDPVMSAAHWNVATQQTISKSGELNQRGAMWTAAAVVLSTASTLVGSFQ